MAYFVDFILVYKLGYGYCYRKNPYHVVNGHVLQDSDIDESSNLRAPVTPSLSDVDDGEEVVSW